MVTKRQAVGSDIKAVRTDGLAYGIAISRSAYVPTCGRGAAVQPVKPAPRSQRMRPLERGTRHPPSVPSGFDSPRAIAQRIRLGSKESVARLNFAR
jgi:hypothetical protein